MDVPRFMSRVILISFLFSSALGLCPYGWIRRKQHCYFMYDVQQERATASILCSSRSSFLVDFADLDEWNFLSSLLATSSYQDDGAWTSLDYKNKSWTFDTPFGTKYSELQKWQDGKPGGGLDDKTGAIMVRQGNDSVLKAASPSTKAHGFCKRIYDSRDFCDETDGWMKMDSLCLKIFHSQTQDEAYTTCTSSDAYLFLPSNAHDIQLLQTVLNMNQTIWVDGHRESRNDEIITFKRKDGSVISFRPWLNSTSGVDLDLPCVAASHTLSSTGFITAYCSEERDFICTKGIGLCPLGWLQHGESCYAFHTHVKDKVDWFTAYKTCSAQNAEMVLPFTDAREFIYKVLQENDINSAWLGLSGTTEDMQDIHGHAVLGNLIQYDTTENVNGEFFCGSTDFNPTRDNYYFAQYCFAQKHFVCSIDMYTPPKSSEINKTLCDDGWEGFDGNCYKIMSMPSTFNDAVGKCQSIGASLAVPTDAGRQTFFSSSIFERFQLETFWINIQYKPQIGKYLPAGSSKAQFYNFDTDQKYNDTDANCVFVKSGKLATFKGAWYKEICTSRHDFVCQKKGSIKQMPRDINIPWSPHCGPGWLHNNETDICYWFSLYHEKSWNDARIACMDRSSDLLSISSQEEQDYIEKLLAGFEYIPISKPLWIGAGDKGGNYGWTWSDDSAFSFLHWDEAEPRYSSDDSSDDGDNCGRIPISKAPLWEARSCGDRNLYICKKTATYVSQNKQEQKPTTGTCTDPLISGEYSIQDSQAFTASSFLDQWHKPENSRLIPVNTGAWSPAHNRVGEWLGVTFISPMAITKMAIRGDELATNGNLVTKFKIQYRYDEQSLWYWTTSKNKSVQIYEMDGYSQERTVIYFDYIEAKFIRIYPVEWKNGISIRWEISGCPRDQCKPEFAMSGPLIIDDKDISASSFTTGHEPYKARLRSVHEDGTISPWINDPSDKKPWIQVDFGKLRILRGIRLMKGSNKSEYLTKFQLQFQTSDGNSFIDYSQPYGTTYTFDAFLSDSEDSKTIFLKSSIEANVIRLVSTEYKGSPNIFFDVLICSTGTGYWSKPLLSRLPDSSLSSNDHGKDSKYSPYNSRIQQDSWKFWKADSFGHTYIKADLGIPLDVTAVATQGALTGSWITSYSIGFSNDGRSFSSPFEKMFPGNFDDMNIVKYEFPEPVTARYIMLTPLNFTKESVLRWEVYGSPKPSSEILIGCYADDPADPDLPYSLDQNTYKGSIWSRSCMSHCYQRGYLYAGIQNGNRCSCGNDYGRYGMANGCNIQCQDPYFNFTCGGNHQNNIYNTGVGPLSRVCLPDWSSYDDSCYLVIPQAKTWPDAAATCMNLNGFLAQINSQHENDFVVSLLDSAGGSNLSWIGLNDIHNPLNFEWSSEPSDVTFTNWDYHQPFVNPGLEQHSVAINRMTEGWTNIFSESRHGFVCKSSKKPSSFPRKDTKVPGCLKGWQAYRHKCFLFQLNKATWNDAQAWCQNVSQKKGNLATIPDGSYLYYLSSQLAQMKGYFWIGVQDAKKDGAYVDINGNSIAVAYWQRNKPDKGGHCVSVGSRTEAGSWTNVKCTMRRYFICEMPGESSTSKSSVSPTLNPSPTPLDKSCPKDWIEIGSYCYQYNSSSPKTKLTWHEAKQSCTDIGAELASFHSPDDFNNLQTEINKVNNNANNYWIGLNNFDKDIVGYKWSDETVLNFIAWSPDQPPKDATERSCGEVTRQTNKMALQNCNLLRDWVCGIKKGSKLKSPKTFVYPKATGQCDGRGWLKYKDHCYQFTDAISGTNFAKTWQESRQWCQDFGGDLASINSEEENYFIQDTMLRFNWASYGKVWIGLNELGRYYGYSWSDGSPTGKWTLNWNVNEPNNFRGYESCVSMLARNGKWQDEHCALRQGFICKRLEKDAKFPLTPLKPALSGNCPNGFRKFGSKCYSVRGGNKGLTWDQAKKACQNLIPTKKIDLASITSLLENAFVTTLLRESVTSAWIGLTRHHDSGEYVWSDSTDLEFVAWNRQEPNMAAGQDACVYMYKPESEAGRWNDVSCSQVAPYICQTSIDPTYPAPIDNLPSSKCESYPDFYLHGHSCLLAVKRNMSWTNASKYCQQKGANLSTVMNAYDLAENIVLSDDPDVSIWLGLNDLKMAGQYVWSNGFPVKFTHWARHQPNDYGNSFCVFLNSQGLMNKGDCSDQHHFICQIDFEIPDVNLKTTSGYCPHSSFSPLGAFCYKVMNESKKTFADAQQDCLKIGTTLASIPDNTMIFPVPSGTRIWIGLQDSFNEGFSWEDGTALAYTNWAQNHPNLNETEKGCVSLDESQQWYSTGCVNTLAYVCMEKKVDTSVTATPSIPTPEKPTDHTPTPDKPTPTKPSPSSTMSQKTPHTKTSSTISQRTSKTTENVKTTIPTKLETKTFKSTKIHTGTMTSSSVSTQRTLHDKQNGSNRLTGGEVAGLVIGLLLLVALAFVGVFFLYRHRERLASSFLRREANKTKNFENSLYEETQKESLSYGGTTSELSVPMEDDNRKVSFVPGGQNGARDISVSFSPDPANKY